MSSSKFLIIIICLLSFNSFSLDKGTNCVDTAIVILKKYSDYSHHNLAHNFFDAYYLNDTLFYYNNRKIRKKATSLKKEYDSGKFDICRNKSYFLFYTKDGRLIAEGFWNIEGFDGLSKEYYKNRKLKEEGTYNGALKINKWSYYDESGKLVRTEKYDEKGNLIHLIF